MAFMASTRSAMHRHAHARVGAVVGHLLAVPARSDAELQAPAGEGSMLATSLAVMIGSRSMTRQMPLPTRSRLVASGRRGHARRTGHRCGSTCGAGLPRPGMGYAGSRGCACARRRTATRGPAPRPGGQLPPGLVRREWERLRHQCPCPRSSPPGHQNVAQLRLGGKAPERRRATVSLPPMTTFEGIAERFMTLHYGARPLLQPNAYNVGSARVLASLGFEAIATTSSGFAATLGRLDGSVTRDETLAHAAQLAGAVDIPVAADTENGFADDPDDVAETVRLACTTGLAGCSVEDFNRDGTSSYDIGLATARVSAAADAAHRGHPQLVLTARADNYVHGRPDFADTIARLQAFQEAGADVLFAPGLLALADIRSLVSSVDRPVNVLALAGCPTVEELNAVGVARVSSGGAFAFAALAGVVKAALELREQGTYRYWEQVAAGREKALEAFRPEPQ